MQAIPITALSIASPLGLGLEATRAQIAAGRSGLRPNDFGAPRLDCYIGRVEGVGHAPVTGRLAAFDCRSHRIARLALIEDDFSARVTQARARYGAARIAVLVGTTTAGMHSAERAYRERSAPDAPLPDWFSYAHTQNLGSVGEFVQRWFDLSGPVCVISTACSSSAKVFASAARYLAAGLCDAAIVGGCDSLCDMTVYGFGSLGLVAHGPCRPCDARRDGLSIGEAAAFALLEPGARSDLCLLGYGESSDAYHMSSPDPEGRGAYDAMLASLARAGLGPDGIDYINLHGTGSLQNDAAEDVAITRLFGTGMTVSSTKGWTGHTLGAAGAVEAVLCCLALRDGVIPGTINTQHVDPQIRSRVLCENTAQPIRRGLSNSFGFGGANCSLILGKSA
ncbi:MAG: beta-ketoacyl-[acyl-carrier-protein] synthase family protein [Gammaproteobacteria bacterium]